MAADARETVLDRKPVWRTQKRHTGFVLLVCLLAIPLAGDAESLSAVASDAPDIDRAPQAWWRDAREELLASLVLSAEQEAGIDAIIAEAAEVRARARELKRIVEPSNGADAGQIARARSELQTLRPKLDLDRRIDAIRTLLAADQQVRFDRNRRLRSDRLFAEFKRRQERAARPRRANSAVSE